MLLASHFEFQLVFFLADFGTPRRWPVVSDQGGPSTYTLHGAYYDQGDPSAYTLHGAYYDQGDPSAYTLHGAYYDQGDPSTYTLHGAYYDQGDPSAYTLHGAYYDQGDPYAYYTTRCLLLETQLYQIKVALLHIHYTVLTT